MTNSDRRVLTPDLGVGMRAALQGWQAEMWTALPGYVTKFDPVKLICEVQPTIQARVTLSDGTKEWKTFPKLLDCPVVFPSGGGFTLTFPIAVGDEVLVVFSSRCIDSWWQSSGVAVQAELRMHDLSDGFVIPGPRSVPKVPVDVSTTDVRLRNADGTTYFGIDPSGVASVVSASEVDVTAPSMVLTGAVTITGNVAITGSLTVSGAVVALDFVTPTLPSYVLHQHDNVRGGPDLCNKPVTGT